MEFKGTWIVRLKTSLNCLALMLSIAIFVQIASVVIGYEYISSYTRASYRRMYWPHCDLTGVKSWKENVVTLLQPRIDTNCSALAAGDERELKEVEERLRTWENVQSEDEFLKSLDNCSHITEEYFNNFYTSPEEKIFPLAYALMVHTNVRQVLRLLKVIYRPHNLYCIHPDAKQGSNFSTGFLSISRCLKNVFVASKLENVSYEHHSIMDAQLNCIEDLMQYDHARWKYVINLCGRELPLMTNRKIVQSLTKLNSTSVIKPHEISERDLERFAFKVAVDSHGHAHYTQIKLGPVPFGIKIYKAMTYMALTRPFTSFLLNNETAVVFRKYLEDVKNPEEHFYGSMYKLYVENLPGGGPPIVRMLSVNTNIWLHNTTCNGRNVHNVCVVSSGDLPLVYSKGLNLSHPAFFFNKYFMETDHVIMDCMEQRLVELNKLEYAQDCLT